MYIAGLSPLSENLRNFFLISHQNLILKIMQNNNDMQIFKTLCFTYEIESLSHKIGV